MASLCSGRYQVVVRRIYRSLAPSKDAIIGRARVHFIRIEGRTVEGNVPGSSALEARVAMYREIEEVEARPTSPGLRDEYIDKLYSRPLTEAEVARNFDDRP